MLVVATVIVFMVSPPLPPFMVCSPPLFSYGPAYTMPATPRGGAVGGSSYIQGSLPPSKNRSSLRVGVATRNGGLGKGVSLPGGVVRSSSTLPRMSAKQLQQPIPHNSPSFLRPNSTINFPLAPIGPAPLQLVTQLQSFQPQHATSPPSSSSSPKACDINDMDMEELCKSITEHVLPDGEQGVLI